jgi:hypothetical protein
METTRYISSRIAGVILLICLGGVLHQYLIYPHILKSEGWLKELAEKRINNNPEVIYFSASTNKALGPDDKDQRFISKMISDSIDLRLEPIDTGAVHAGIFYAILQKIPKDKLPKLIVVDMNIRSFGENWIHSGLENSLQRNLVYWNDAPGVINHLKASVKWYDYKSPMEHQRAIEYAEKFAKLPFGGSHRTIKTWCDSIFKASKDPEEAMTMVRHFGFRINEKNEQLKRFDEISVWSEKNNVPVIFVILPENIEKMELLAGKDLKDLVQMNAEFLEKRYRNRSFKTLNLYNRAAADIFFESFPTEHYRSGGRTVVADAIIRAINEFEKK